MEYKGMLIPRNAPHKQTFTEKEEIHSYLSHSRALLLRDVGNFGCTDNRAFYYVIKDTFDGLNGLKRRDRNKIRHAEKFFYIQPLEYAQLKKDGFEVYKSTYDGYKKKTERMMSRREYEQRLDKIKTSREFFGCIEKTSNRIAAYAELFIMDNACFMYTVLADPRYTRNGYYALYGLYYEICRHYLSENKLAYVSNGCKSMTERSNVHDFLIARFGFRKVYADMRVTYKWWFGCLVRALYPFRHVFSNSKLKAVMRQEEINRIMKSVSPTAC